MIEGLQQKNISLDKGIVRTPSLGVEGELSECVNLIPHAGEMVRIHEPQPLTEDVTGQYLYYTLVWERIEGQGSFIYTALSGYEDLRYPCPMKIKYLHSTDRTEQTENFTIATDNMVNDFEIDNLTALEDIVSIELGDKDFMLSLPDIGYVGLKAYRLFEFATPQDIAFPTEEEQANMPLELQPGELLLETNRCAGKENLIVRNGNTIAYYRPGEDRKLLAIVDADEFKLSTLGQTIVISHGLVKRYFVWGEEGYKERNIADFVPRVEFALGDNRKYSISKDNYNATNGYPGRSYISNSWRAPEEYDVTLDYNTLTDGSLDYTIVRGYEGGDKEEAEKVEAEIKETRRKLIESWWGYYNERRAEIKNAGAVCFPFFVRYGVELYDGSVINLSPPIFITPSDRCVPSAGMCIGDKMHFVSVNLVLRGEAEYFSVTPIFCQRNFYVVIDASCFDGIDDNLIKGIVVYATPEIEVVDTSGKETDVIFSKDRQLKFLPAEYKEDFLGNMLSLGAPPSNEEVASFTHLWKLPVKENLTEDLSRLTDPTEFYELGRVSLSDLKKNGFKVYTSPNTEMTVNSAPSFGPVDTIVKEGYLWPDEDSQAVALSQKGYSFIQMDKNVFSTLTSHPRLTEALVSQKKEQVVSANTTYSYNSRLLYGGIITKESPLVYASQILADSRTLALKKQSESFPQNIYLQIKDSYQTIPVEEDFLKGFPMKIPFLAVPYNDATGVCIIQGDTGNTQKISKVGLTRRDASLGGYALWTYMDSYWLRQGGHFGQVMPSSEYPGDKWKSNSYLDALASDLKGNTVAVTKVANPWVIEAICELACGEIRALTGATEALSEGQFGEFPIYAFTDNGIYALSIAQDGTIESKQPISRDVLLKMSNTLQIDKAIIYPTKEGLKLISGRNTSLLSVSIAGLNAQESVFSAPPELTIADVAPFQEQLEDIKMVYDYAHRQVHLFSERETTEGKQKHYVYDLESGQWATQILDKQLTTCVAGYPFSTMQFGRQLMQYTNELEADVLRDGWFLTRPMSFNDPYTRKMLWDLRVMGQKTNPNTKWSVQVYISEDRNKWQRLTSLKGRSAKWYRFLLKASMTGLDTLTGIACQFVPRLGNKLR